MGHWQGRFRYALQLVTMKINKYMFRKAFILIVIFCKAVTLIIMKINTYYERLSF